MDEQGYLDVLRKVMEQGNDKEDRTNTGTRSIFGEQMRFSLKNQFPLLTTKRTYWKGIAKELLWFIKGSTDANELKEDNIHIWDGNSSREFLDSVGLTENEEGDLGPVYGFNWRHWNAEYNTCKTDYTNEGIDQLKDVIEQIKTRPDSRRILMTSWNPSTLKQVALPACHTFCQFYVNGKDLSCHMYQRSVDMFLGSPFNIASYSLLTYMIAHVCELEPKELIISTGDTHIYNNHVDQVNEQLERKPKKLPRLKIKRRVNDIDDFTYDDFEIEGYECYPTIKAKMAV